MEPSFDDTLHFLRSITFNSEHRHNNQTTEMSASIIHWFEIIKEIDTDCEN